MLWAYLANKNTWLVKFFGLLSSSLVDVVKSTNGAYQSSYKWAVWYFKNLHILASLNEQHSTVNTIRSAVPVSHDRMECVPIGQHLWSLGDYSSNYTCVVPWFIVSASAGGGIMRTINYGL